MHVVSAPVAPKGCYGHAVLGLKHGLLTTQGGEAESPAMYTEQSYFTQCKGPSITPSGTRELRMFGTLSSLVLRRSSHLATVSRSSSMATASRPVLRGVIFDMDGTLTKPNLDFTEMYRQVARPLAARGTCL